MRGKRLAKRVYAWLFPRRSKEQAELAYWRERKMVEGALVGEHYGYFYTTHFGLTREFYEGKRILDIGCGPRGSLQWADMAAERVGMDPLAEEYAKLGAAKQQMSYVKGYSEAIPFDDGYFDVVCSFNSLDHVSNLDRTVSEIGRVTKSQGLFLLLTDVNHQPTPTEPISFTWDITNRFSGAFDLLGEQYYERVQGGLYASILDNRPYDLGNTAERYGVLSAKFQKR